MPGGSLSGCGDDGFLGGNGTRALPRLRVVGDAKEALAQLDRGREFAPLLIDGADRSGIRLGDDEHRWSMGRRLALAQSSHVTA